MDRENITQKERPLLSIILPNRGHFEFVQETIRNILEIEDNRIELIINDNSSPHEFDFSPFLSDKRVSVYIEQDALSMTKNWWNGLSRARGRWVTFIGADDGVVSKNFSQFLDTLAETDSKVVTTRQSVFSYTLNGRSPQLQIPAKEPKGDTRIISYPFRAAAFFPKLRNTVLPIPYNGSVVRLEILKDILTCYSQMPGIAPDDYLGQYVAQHCKKGLFLDSLVFIQGTSERSNGIQIHGKIGSAYSTEFVSDSRKTMGRLIKQFGWDCLSAVALEHYFIVWEALHRKHNPLSHAFSTYWCFLACQEKRHSHGTRPRYIAWFLSAVMNMCASTVQKFWLVKNFGLKIPFRTTPIELPIDSTVRTASRVLSTYQSR